MGQAIQPAVFLRLIPRARGNGIDVLWAQADLCCTAVTLHALGAALANGRFRDRRDALLIDPLMGTDFDIRADPQPAGIMVYTVLGGNNTGGIIWHPSILEAASEHGLYLSKDNMLIDVNAGDTLPETSALLPPLAAEEIAALRDYSIEEMRQRAVTGEARQWSTEGLLDAVLPGHGGEIAPVIGYGISQDKHSAAPITQPHGFSVEWLRLRADHQVGRHLCPDIQVIMVFKGSLEITWNQAGEEVSVIAPERSIVSIPANSWRRYRAVEGSVECILTTQGDQRKRLYWDEEILLQARARNRGLDPDGYVSKLDILPATARHAGARLESRVEEQ